MRQGFVQAPGLAIIKLVSHGLPYSSSSLPRATVSSTFQVHCRVRILPALSTSLMASIIIRRPTKYLRPPVPVASRSYVNGRGAYLVSPHCSHDSYTDANHSSFDKCNVECRHHDHAGGDYNSPRFKLLSAIGRKPRTPHSGYSRQPSLGRRRALCIGINYRNKLNELKGCIEDTKKISRFLKENGYTTDDITVLTDDTIKKPTRSNILDALSRLFRGAQPNDSLFLHYSEHGDQIPDTNGDEVDIKDERIESYDSLHIIDDDIHEILRSLPSGCQLTALFDNCHSGTILDLPYTYNCIGQCYGTTQGLDISADVICWSGTKDNQKGRDTSEGGVMTNAFIDALKYKPKQSYKELLHSIRTIVEYKHYEQIPQLGSSRQIDPDLNFIL
ncbi:caspase domain-containing protein [Armillaria luteobubalina]|uniref:Caspase domain-containing protein n=1 Tax=Armillaria luteobubalina TaxID=153913 RepID=A0AA39QPH1_9AGAR|nr:caspase domain-containing protein [Armillaria luteobubalina]